MPNMLVMKHYNAFCLFMICSIIKKVAVCMKSCMQNAVREKPAKLELLTLLKVRLWLVLEYFRNGKFREFWDWTGGNFPVYERWP